MLHVNSVVSRIGGRTLLDGASAHVPEGQRVGLVGRNGTGKTTLFRLILGERSPDGGSIAVRPRARVGQVAQEAPDGEISLLDCVLAADTERAALLAELDGHPDPHRVADLHERLAVIGAHGAPARAGAILCGLGFASQDHTRAVGTFSGGWRMRVALAAALFARPDLLLLDEPTNHLDLEATLWLESFLASYPGTLIVISHDRDLLNRAVERILHLENGKLVSYQGNFDRFERTRAERLEHLAKAAQRQAEERRHIQAFVDRFRAKATKARQAQSRLKRLERMTPITATVEEAVIPFDFPDPESLPPPVIAVENGVAGYGDTVVLRGLNFRLDMDDRVALLGANGNGKSTLAKVLAGRLDLLGGELRAPSKLRIGYFAQHQTEELRLGETPLQHGRRLMGDLADQKIRAHLGRFGFGEARVNTPVSSLSGGEKARLLIALTCREAPHLLILDEPTNHLDIDSRESLMRALNVFQGAVVLISHDPRLVEMVADRLWLVDGGTLTPFDGDMDDYRALLLERAREARREGSASGPSDALNSAQAQKDRRRAAAEARTRLAPLRKAVEAAEKKLATLEKKKTEIEAKLADPALYQGPAAAVTALQRDLGEVQRALAEAEETWLLAHEALETATAAEPALAEG
ncbi:ABC-F family ATP-binding cassette domain-containing protein [Pararhodospirillum photometricum]|uniref:ABC transporter component n=1 Tax=Pararhodospirillum photometricum DSM 122 TaxID=1150469 RepID=H6SQY4_PARPM|nr:ABC-F family ATP-binding cassette domain-containing protein [Pararhodospirillum photometricum]CCG07449.1 ABC transporter component [Pararhodospirillum photometricum DSM 122]